ncbi:hypothetical protein C7974DRAFT_77492 [Boeremia exigua]|uniref:uncharacterized protein n=1 Tax=Boeremia exigua TaxID=749465 RepID=UPI001E8D8CC5|nr:uncharacterized protein C7974DRAFT_77492 [Boeremia exigua]KAH6612404.1 hypothetical protein C7974DRAFT_77492 [Boeremia exigua]
MSINYYQRIVEEFTFENKPLLLASTVSSAVGFLTYFMCVRKTLTEGKGPMPFWMHTFFLAHDSVWCYLLGQAAPQYDNHWYLAGMSKGLFVWSLLEIWCIYKTIKEDRKRTFSSFFGPDPPLSSVLFYTVANVLAMYGIVVLGIILMGDECVMQWFGLTNVVAAVGPMHEYLRRGSREGLSLVFCFLNIIGTIWTFAPFGMWVLVLPEIYDQFAYYAIGSMMVLYSILAYAIVAAYPSKTKLT